MLRIEVESGKINAGDNKHLRLIPKNSKKQVISVAELVATISRPGGEDASTYRLSAGTIAPEEGGYGFNHLFANPGRWKIEVVGTDIFGGPERETHNIFVYP